MAAVVAPSPTPRRIKKPSWLDIRLAVGLALVIGSVVSGAVVVGHAQTTVPVVVATRDLAEDSQLGAGDLAVRRVQLSAPTLSRYARQPQELIGKRLTVAITRDELVPLAVARHSAPSTSLAIPLADGMAPALRAGQRIELWLTTPACHSIVLLPAATVQEARAVDSSFAGNGGQTVMLSLEPALASRVIGALDLANAHIRAGVLSGPPPPGARLADLDACTAPPAAGR